MAPRRAGEIVSRRLLLAITIGTLACLAVPTGLVALTQGIGAMPLAFSLHVVDERLPGIFRLHMLASGAALALMPAVIATRRSRAWHRPLGRLTGALVAAGALTALPVALASLAGPVARLGFAAQGGAWLALVVLGVAAIRRGERERHARLMLAMAAVASGAIWVRLAMAIATSWDLPFDPVYAGAAWLGWLVPLALVLALSPGLGRNRAVAPGGFIPARPRRRLGGGRGRRHAAA
jgi:hypothetical protein